MTTYPTRPLPQAAHPNRGSVPLAVFLLVVLAVAVVAGVLAIPHGPKIDVQTDMRRVETQCGNAAAAGMGSSQAYIQNGQDVYPKYWGPGLIATVDRRTGHAECYE